MEMEKAISNQKNKMSIKYPTELANEVIENQTKKIPNLVFMALAGASILGSALLTFSKEKKELGNFVGLWAPTILLLGLYNKIVKVEDELLTVVKK